jgi:hypothetical protein
VDPVTLAKRRASKAEVLEGRIAGLEQELAGMRRVMPELDWLRQQEAHARWAHLEHCALCTIFSVKPMAAPERLAAGARRLLAEANYDPHAVLKRLEEYGDDNLVESWRLAMVWLIYEDPTIRYEDAIAQPYLKRTYSTHPGSLPRERRTPDMAELPDGAADRHARAEMRERADRGLLRRDVLAERAPQLAADVIALCDRLDVAEDRIRRMSAELERASRSRTRDPWIP